MDRGLKRTEATQKISTKYITEIDQHELAVRLIEIGCHMKRPPGTSGGAAWETFRQSADKGEIPAYIVDDFEAMAVAAIEYFRERIAALQEPH